MEKICMNEVCKATATSLDWKRGWELKSGGFATLCYSCGSVYENALYCETFHLDESGWRECRLCGKRIHCGCIVSKGMHDFLDVGGIGCIGCSKKMENQPLRPLKVPNGDIPNGFIPRSMINAADPQSSFADNQKDSFKDEKGKILEINKNINDGENLIWLSKAMVENETPEGKIKQEGEVRLRPSLFAKPSLSFSLASPFRIPNNIEEKKPNEAPSLQQGERATQIFQKLPKGGSDANKGTASETRVARPPAEGRGRSQLLPRYWPRITDQELQQISGDLNSTIVPLFEKVLSASDAGRIGRLVLPKACAEAYFPPIYHSEGLPIKVQDIKGKEWKFQFRFWPNNNSRMYVLEGVTPCIQNMQLQAGDTVTFSRIDPGGNLVIGFRKSSSDMQDGQSSALPNSAGFGEASLGASDNQPTDGGGSNEGIAHRRNMIPEKKKTRNIGSKSKRLHMHSDEAMELRVTWDEAQDLLRPTPTAKPNIVMIEDHVFEEYEEPPVFGKRTIFTAGASGNQEQWAQCDSCFKWRRLPVEFLVPPKWICSENIWDSSRCSCSAIGEINPAELDRFLRAGRDIKTRKITQNPYSEHEASGLDALATAAFLGENTEGPGESSAGPTTRHPRHRPGCSCIVCIQPPSGKGRHKPTCICNVCLTVKRRFKTLMLRKKKRQSDREEELALEREKEKKLNGANENGFSFKSLLGDEKGEGKNPALDLNCDPIKEEETGMSERHPPEEEIQKEG